MEWLKKRKETPLPAAVQLRDGERHPFGMLRGYVPLRGEVQLYRAVREAVPVVDAAIYKLIRLAGGVDVRCGEERAEAALREFLRTVPVGRGQYGINAFLDCYSGFPFDLRQGGGEDSCRAGEAGRSPRCCADGVEDVELPGGGAHPLDFTIWGPDEKGRMAALPYQHLLLFTPLDPEAEAPFGVSLLRSLPFLTDILMKNLPYHRRQLGAVRERALRRHLPQWRECIEPAGSWPRMVPGHGGDAERQRAGLRGSGRCGYPGHRRGCAHPGQPGAGAADPGADRGQDRDPAFYAGTELELHRADERPAGGYAHHGDHSAAPEPDPCGGAICRMWLRMHGWSCGCTVEWDDINLQDQVEEPGRSFTGNRPGGCGWKMTGWRRSGEHHGAGAGADQRAGQNKADGKQVYTFTLRLCDNEVDRDLERFDGAALERLGELFVGKSGVFDHQWSARGQTARIYRTEVVEEPSRVTAAGDGYRWLKAWAYLLRTEKNAELIAEIEGGIKKEVSVGCSMGRSVCSICGEAVGSCRHVKGGLTARSFASRSWRSRRMPMNGPLWRYLPSGRPAC